MTQREAARRRKTRFDCFHPRLLICQAVDYKCGKMFCLSKPLKVCRRNLASIIQFLPGKCRFSTRL